MEKISVAILGATGTVGQKFITLLENHPFFEVRELVASSRSAGKPYREAVSWKQDRFIPETVGDLIVKTTDDKLESRILFSGMDAEVAGPAEEAYAERGHFVISNSKNHRMDKTVPIIIPEVNSDHFEMIKAQPYKGAIITNSNCSTMFLAMVLAPLHKAFGVEKVFVTTMQAVSGAGYPGVASMDILGNVIPFIGGEEAKMECEAQKILAEMKLTEIVQISGVIPVVPVKRDGEKGSFPLAGHVGKIGFRVDGNSRLGRIEHLTEKFRETGKFQSGILGGPVGDRRLLRLDRVLRVVQTCRHGMTAEGVRIRLAGTGCGIGSIRESPHLHPRNIAPGIPEDGPENAGQGLMTAEKLSGFQKRFPFLKNLPRGPLH